MLTGILVLLGAFMLIASKIEVYRIVHVTVAYKRDDLKTIHGYTFDYVYKWNEEWMNIEEWEDAIKKIKDISVVHIVGVKIYRKWKIRKSVNESKS